MYRLIFIVLFIAGCTSEMPIDTWEFNDPLQIEFDAIVTHPDERYDVFSVNTGPNELIVSGFLWTAQAGYTLTAHAKMGSRAIVLEVSAEFTTGGITIPMHHSYNAKLKDIPPGRYHILVVHTKYGRTDTVYKTVIVVS